MKTVYPLKPFYKITYSLSAILGVAFISLRLQGRLIGWSDWSSNIFVTGWAVIILVFLYDAIFKKLTISESGIEYQAFLQHFFLAWNQIEDIPARLSFKVLTGKSSDGKKRNVHLYFFKDHPIDSELGQQIKQYAPHLFEKENQQSA